jgi:hypothetical protein
VTAFELWLWKLDRRNLRAGDDPLCMLVRFPPLWSRKRLRMRSRARDNYISIDGDMSASAILYNPRYEAYRAYFAVLLIAPEMRRGGELVYQTAANVCGSTTALICSERPVRGPAVIAGPLVATYILAQISN